MVVAQQPKIVPAEAVSSEAPSAPPQAVSAPEKLVFEENTDPEGDQVSKFEWDYNAKIDEKLLEFDYEQSIPNANFIYHNKLPKSGSTTMHDILRYKPTFNSTLKQVFNLSQTGNLNFYLEFLV